MRFKHSLTCLFFVLFCFSQVYSQDFYCPIGYYINKTNDCVPQHALKATVHPTVEDRVFILTFNTTPVPFKNATDLQERAQISLASPTLNIVTNFSVNFLVKDRTVAQILLDVEEIPFESKLKIDFPNFRLNNLSKTYIDNTVTFSSLPYSPLSGKDSDTVSALTKLDRGLEYAWIVVSCLNPYAFLYMNTKLYRETLEMFKRVDVPYGPVATEFFRQNNNKFSGFKAPNMFPIIIMGNDVTSGWNRGEENGLPYGEVDSDRVQDLKIVVTESVHNYDAYPLFLDNYGIQITVFFAVIVLIIIVELINFIFFRNSSESKSIFRRIFQATRTFLKWNLLLACVIGSYQSLVFYIMVQIEAFATYERWNGHNTVNFWFAITSLIVLGVGFPLWLIYKVTSVYKQAVQQKESYSYLKERYGIFFMFNDLNRPATLVFVFALLARAIIFAVLTLLLNGYPIAQVASMLAVSIVFTAYVIYLRPFSKMMYNIYQVGNEFVLVLYLSTLMYMAKQIDSDTIDDHKAEVTGRIFMALWLFLPFLSILFGIVGFGMRLAGFSTQIPLKTKVPIANASAQRQEIVIDNPMGKAEVTKVKKDLKVPALEPQNYERSPANVIVDVLENVEKEDEAGAQRQPKSMVPTDPVFTNEVSQRPSSIASIPHIEVVPTLSEEVERDRVIASWKNPEKGKSKNNEQNSPYMSPRTAHETSDLDFTGILGPSPEKSESQNNKRSMALRLIKTMSDLDEEEKPKSKAKEVEKRNKPEVKDESLYREPTVKMSVNKKGHLEVSRRISHASDSKLKASKRPTQTSTDSQMRIKYLQEEGFKKCKERFTNDE